VCILFFREKLELFLKVFLLAISDVIEDPLEFSRIKTYFYLFSNELPEHIKQVCII